MNFEEFVNDWWQGYIDTHKDGNNLSEIFSQMGYNEEEYLGEGDTIEDFLGNLDADDVYAFFFGYDAKASDISDIPLTDEFCTDMYLQAAKEAGMDEYSFVNDFAFDMASESVGYSHPESFFSDLQRGCQTGMIGSLVYNSDCKRTYIEHIDSMEDFKSECEDELGEPIRNRQELPHYTFMCWFCYEELGYRIAQILFPDKY